MALPTNGYNPHRVEYFIGSDAGVTLTMQGTINTGANEAAMEELLTYLDSALSSFKTDYEANTVYTATINKSFNGDTTPTSI